MSIVIGGPNTILPKPIESFLSWSLCIACLSIPTYHYYVSNHVKPFFMKLQRKQIKASLSSSSSLPSTKLNESSLSYKSFLDCWIPLTTHSRSEIERKTPIQRYEQLIQFLYHIITTTKSSSSINNGETLTNFDWTSEEQFVIEHLDDDTLVTLMRENTICRRLASLVMRPYKLNTSTIFGSSMVLLDHPHLILIQRLAHLWPKLLELPSPTYMFSIPEKEHDDKVKKDEDYRTLNISLIVPSYNEVHSYIQKQIQLLLHRCSHPRLVEVVIVNAGDADETAIIQDSLSQYNNGSKDINKCWGRIKVLSFIEGGGRGPCLNYGAKHSNGYILSFCHLDTVMPNNWDVKVCTMFNDWDGSETRANSCAFGFGINKEECLNAFSSLDKGYFPPGIKAVETTANIRTNLFSLPYGDQVISMPRNMFNFFGGFPDQCLMEDYELVALLRRRALLISTQMERLKIIPGEPAYCSPRRWQKFGVLYVTSTNSRLVNLYSGGMGPDELYRRYYGRQPPTRKNELSPWEVEMNEILHSSVVAQQNF